jgi:flagellar basal body-associated protein FliL
MTREVKGLSGPVPGHGINSSNVISTKAMSSRAPKRDPGKREPMKKTKETWIPVSTGMTNEKETAEINNNENKTMKKNKVIFFGIIIIVVIALAAWAGFVIAGTQSGSANPDTPSPYSAVYLSTGDIYFGKLSWFPSPHMTNVWFIQRSTDQGGQAQVSFVPMKSVFYGPMDEINFNAQDIVFSTRLKNSSQIVAAMENPTSVGQQAVASSTVPSEPSATSTK